MNLLRVAFTAASHKTFGHMLRSGMIRGFATADNLESEQVVEKINRRGDFVTSNTLINDMLEDEEELSRAVVEVSDPTRRVKGLSPNKTTYTFLIFSLCIHNRYDDAYRVLNEMFVSGFSPSLVTWKNVFVGFLGIGDIKKAFETRNKVYKHFGWTDDATESSLSQCLSDKVTYTSLMNAYLDEGKWNDAEELFHFVQSYGSFSYSVLHRVIINGLDKKTRTTEIKKHLLRFNYEECLDWPFFEYHSTMVPNNSDDEYKNLVELVNRFCNRGLENAYDTMLKSNYKPDGIDDDGIVYNLFLIAHCKRRNIDEAYNMYKEMVHYGFACHMFTVFALIKTLSWKVYGSKLNKDMVDKLLWVIRNVLRSCNVNESEIVNYINEFNPDEPMSEALFDVLAEKAKDGLFLKCSYAPPSA